MSCAILAPTQASAALPAPGAGVCVCVWVRAFIDWLLSLAPIERARAGAAQMLLLLLDILEDPDFSPSHPLYRSDCRHVGYLLDVADAMISAYIFLLARQQAGLSLVARTRASRLIEGRNSPTRANIEARYKALHRRFLTAEARAQRPAARMIASDALARLVAPAQPELETRAPQTCARRALASAPAAHRPGLIERLLAIADGIFSSRLIPAPAPG